MTATHVESEPSQSTSQNRSVEPTRRSHYVAVGIAALLLALAVDNVWRFHRNQEQLGCERWFCVAATDLFENALGHSHPSVRARLAIVYWLKRKLPGAKITIPPWMAHWGWDLHRIAGLEVTVSEYPLRVRPNRQSRLRVGANTAHFYWYKTGEPGRRVFYDLYVLIRPDESEYVIAESDSDALFLIPRSLYSVVKPRKTRPAPLEGAAP